MRVPTRTGVVCGVAALALVAAGCSSDSDDSGSSNSDAAITIDSVEPENPLIPGNTTETGGGRVVDALFTGLVEYKTEDAAPYNAVAESIDTKDSKVFTIKLKKDWTFHDGTPVTAKSYADAWNWTAYSPNAAQSASFFEQIQGYADVHPADPDGESGAKKAPTPTTKEMSGLKVVDDLTLEVTLGAPFSVFPVKLGYAAFAPLPEAFFKDPKAFGEKPIGNGPFKFEKWDHKKQITISRFDNFKGEQPKVKTINLKLYQSQDAAYADLQSNNLDFQQQVPTASLTGDQWKSDLQNRTVEREVGVWQAFTFPLYDAKFTNVKFRQAISMALDRKLITEKIFAGSRTPATGFVSPAVDGYKAGQCGEYCTYDAAKAKAALAESGFKGDFTFAYNANGDHKAWVEAACNSINGALGPVVKCLPKPYTEFSEFRAAIDGRKMTGAFRNGWQQDYPSIENYLNPLYRTHASSNDQEYSNPAVDAKLKEADAATSPEAGVKLYQEAEALLAPDLPSIPLWYVKQQGGYSTKVKNVKFTTFGELDFIAIEAK